MLNASLALTCRSSLSWPRSRSDDIIQQEKAIFYEAGQPDNQGRQKRWLKVPIPRLIARRMAGGSGFLNTREGPPPIYTSQFIQWVNGSVCSLSYLSPILDPYGHEMSGEEGVIRNWCSGVWRSRCADKASGRGHGRVRKMRAGSNEDQVEEHWREGAEDLALKKSPPPKKKEGMALTTNLKGNCFIHSL